MMIYSNDIYYLVWKPHGFASTFGQQESLLDLFSSPDKFKIFIQNNSDFSKYYSYCYLEWYKEIDIFSFLHNQTRLFNKDQEYGLLNRLDNDTWGFLYFAKNPEIYGLYKAQQSKWAIQKVYLAQVHGNPFFKSSDTTMTIETPIMHHAFDDQKMITVATDADQTKGRWSLHHVATTLELISYDQQTNTSLLRVTIHKWVRHQIRIHCKSIGAPILWDILYGPKPPQSSYLNLRSIGMKN